MATVTICLPCDIFSFSHLNCVLPLVFFSAYPVVRLVICLSSAILNALSTPFVVSLPLLFFILYRLVRFVSAFIRSSYNVSMTCTHIFILSFPLFLCNTSLFFSFVFLSRFHLSCPCIVPHIISLSTLSTECYLFLFICRFDT